MDKVTHFEIPIENPERAERFYKSIFGWKIMKWEGSLPYWIVSTVDVDENMMPKEAGAINGGFTMKEDIDKVIIVISVKDIDRSISNILKNKGKIIAEKRKVGDMGWYTRFKDSEGNVIGLWQDIKK